MTDSEFWIIIRSALLVVIDAIERMFDINPRTSELRKERKCGTKNTDR